jgi:ParB family chromosome partitioning protein
MGKAIAITNMNGKTINLAIENTGGSVAQWSKRIFENLTLASCKGILSSLTTKTANKRITQIPLNKLHPPEFHPFQIYDDESMRRLTESIKASGVIEPGLVRLRADGNYELLCGNRRKRACELAGITTMPVIIRKLDDTEATLAMIDSNLEQRETILPSERAWAYRIMMETLNHNGIKGENHSYEIFAERTGIKKTQLFRIIRLTELITALIDMVDATQLAFNPAVELSYLSVPEQSQVAKAMSAHETKPSLSQAKRLKELKKNGKLTAGIIDAVLSEVKKPPSNEPVGMVRYREYFPHDFSQEQMDAVIIKLLTDWKTSNATTTLSN